MINVMLDKEKVISFFDQYASTWDKDMVKDEKIINQILDNVDISFNQDILDVACGTGVLVSNYQERNISSYLGIDISSKMIEICNQKYSIKNYQFVCGDATDYSFNRKFDRIVVYNAFPHFADQERLIQILSSLLKENGKLTIAHSMSREKINEHHQGVAKDVSNGLMEIEDLKEMVKKYLNVTVTISNDQMYQIVGKYETK